LHLLRPRCKLLRWALPLRRLHLSWRLLRRNLLRRARLLGWSAVTLAPLLSASRTTAVALPRRALLALLLLRLLLLLLLLRLTLATLIIIGVAVRPLGLCPRRRHAAGQSNPARPSQGNRHCQRQYFRTRGASSHGLLLSEYDDRCGAERTVWSDSVAPRLRAKSVGDMTFGGSALRSPYAPTEKRLGQNGGSMLLARRHALHRARISFDESDFGEDHCR